MKTRQQSLLRLFCTTQCVVICDMVTWLCLHRWIMADGNWKEGLVEMKVTSQLTGLLTLYWCLQEIVAFLSYKVVKFCKLLSAVIISSVLISVNEGMSLFFHRHLPNQIYLMEFSRKSSLTRLWIRPDILNRWSCTNESKFCKFWISLSGER